jgi:hypothetical protein
MKLLALAKAKQLRLFILILKETALQMGREVNNDGEIWNI